MASASHVLLLQRLLQRSDRHPIGTLDGADLERVDQRVVEHFLQLGIIVQQTSLSQADGLVFQQVGDALVAVSPEGETASQIVDPALLRQYEIDVSALCRQLRRANGLEGPPVEALNSRVFRVGDSGPGNRRRQHFLARLLRNDNAIDTALAIKGRAGAGTIVMLTPTHRDISPDILRRLEADDVAVRAIPDLLVKDAPMPLMLDLRATGMFRSSDPRAARLVIDARGARAHFDGVELVVAPREFHALIALANEAVDGQGIVTRDTLYIAMMGGSGTASAANDEQIDKSISLLRSALGRASSLSRNEAAALIVNKRKVGYRLDLRPEDIHIF